MSTQIFLGPPPPHVEKWMREHYQKWVPAVYTDEWLFSDGGKYSITYSRYSQDELNKY